MLQLCFKFGESKWNPYWIILIISSGINYAVSRHGDFDQYGPLIAIIWDKAMLQLSCTFSEPKLNPCWVIVSTSSSVTNYVFNEHEDFDQYVLYAIPS